MWWTYPDDKKHSLYSLFDMFMPKKKNSTRKSGIKNTGFVDLPKIVNCYLDNVIVSAYKETESCLKTETSYFGNYVN